VVLAAAIEADHGKTHVGIRTFDLRPGTGGKTYGGSAERCAFDKTPAMDFVHTILVVMDAEKDRPI